MNTSIWYVYSSLNGNKNEIRILYPLNIRTKMR